MSNNSSKYSNDLKRKVIYEYNATNASYGRLSEKYGIPKPTIGSWIKKNGECKKNNEYEKKRKDITRLLNDRESQITVLEEINNNQNEIIKKKEEEIERLQKKNEELMEKNSELTKINSKLEARVDSVKETLELFIKDK